MISVAIEMVKTLRYYKCISIKKLQFFFFGKNKTNLRIYFFGCTIFLAPLVPVHICMHVFLGGALTARNELENQDIHIWMPVCMYCTDCAWSCAVAAAAASAEGSGWFCIHNANTHTVAGSQWMGWRGENGRLDSGTYDERNSCKLRNSGKSSREERQ